MTNRVATTMLAVKKRTGRSSIAFNSTRLMMWHRLHGCEKVVFMVDSASYWFKECLATEGQPEGEKLSVLLHSH